MGQRTGDPKPDRPDRATALKSLVHCTGALHPPFHALGVGRGGNDVEVSVFGNNNCGNDPARPPLQCNLHSVWDGRLIARRDLADGAYVASLETLIKQKGWFQQPVGTPKDWAEQSFVLGKAALVKAGTNIDEAYYQRHITVIDERLALAAVRLSAVLNRALQ